MSIGNVKHLPRDRFVELVRRIRQKTLYYSGSPHDALGDIRLMIEEAADLVTVALRETQQADEETEEDVRRVLESYAATPRPHPHY